MAKKRTGKRQTSSIRLLILFYFFFFYFALAHAGIEDDMELSFSPSPLFIDSIFEVKIKLDDASLYYYESSETPKLIILDDEEVLEFLDSDINSLYGGILITNKYRLKKIGVFELIPYLSLGKYQTKLKNFSVQVEPPALSTNTLFKWKILDSDSYSSVETIVQGTKYLIVLTGFFYDYLQEDGRTSLDVNCQAPEDSILEKIDESSISNMIIEDSGWKAVSYFFWTPLKEGRVSLPMPQISVNSEAKGRRKIYAGEHIVKVMKETFKQNEMDDDEKRAYESLEPALTVKEFYGIQNESNNLKKNFEEKLSNALIIAELRGKEAGTFFPKELKKKRLRCEKVLTLKEGFAVRSAILKKGLLSAFFILAALEIYFVLFLRKKNIGFKFFLMVCLIFILALLIFYWRQYERAVFRPLTYEEVYSLYHIPETSGTVVSSLEIGETVIVKQKTLEWFFIEKKDGTGGWQKGCEFIISD